MIYKLNLNTNNNLKIKMTLFVYKKIEHVIRLNMRSAHLT